MPRHAPKILPSLMASSAFLCLTGPAFADVTAQEVWQNWKMLGAVYGQSYTAGDQQRVGDTLTISNLAIAMDNSDMELTGTIPQVVFRETGTGTVEITMSDSYSMILKTDPDDLRDTLTTRIDIAHDAMTMQASGTPDAITYTMRSNAVTATLGDVVIGAKTRDLAAAVTLDGLTVRYDVTPGDMTGVASSFAANALRYQILGSGEVGDSKLAVKGKMGAIAGEGMLMVPTNSDMADMPAMLAQGYSTKGGLSYEQGSFDYSGRDADCVATQLSSSSAAGAVNVAIDKDRLAYSLSGTGVALKASGGMPVPEVEVAYDEVLLDMSFPVAKSDTAQDFSLTSRIVGLTVSEALLAMLDPAKTLPRDPARLEIALDGTARPLVDLLAEDAPTNIGSPPVALEKLNIRSVALSLAGAMFNATGTLTFDPDAAPMLGGVSPMPVGRITLSTQGISTLLAKLQALGRVDQSATMSFGLFAGMLARPGPTPDSLVSELEFTQDGKILANGNPLPF
jgi:hypothetical protein